MHRTLLALTTQPRENIQRFDSSPEFVDAGEPSANRVDESKFIGIVPVNLSAPDFSVPVFERIHCEFNGLVYLEIKFVCTPE